MAKIVQAQEPASSDAAMPTVPAQIQANSCWFAEWFWSALVSASVLGSSKAKALVPPGAPPGRRQSGSRPTPPRNVHDR